jgi:hypothetical protein
MEPVIKNMYCLRIKRNWSGLAPTLHLQGLPSIEESMELSKAFEQGEYQGLMIMDKNIREHKQPTYLTIDLEFINYFSNIQLLGIIGFYFLDIKPLLKFKNDLVFLSIDVSKCQNPELVNEFSNLKSLKLYCKKGWNGDAIITPNTEELGWNDDVDLRIFDFEKAYKLFCIKFAGNGKHIRHFNLGSAPNVRILDFMFMRNLSEFDFISSMHSLMHISFFWAPKLEAIPDISKLTQLKMISVDTCSRLRDLSAIAHNHSIESLLMLNRISDVEILRPLVDHPSLKYIYASFKTQKLKQQASNMLGDRLKGNIHDLPTYVIGPDVLEVEYPQVT